MEELMNILNGIRPDVDFETAVNLVTDGILDSFDIVSIVAEVNETFDVDIYAEDLVPENFDTAKAIYELICQHQED